MEKTVTANIPATEAWLRKHRLIYDGATRHPFILSIRDGSVDFSAFKRWLGQDYIFVRSLVPFTASILMKSCKVSSDMEVILGGVASLNEEIKWFKTQASKYHVSLTSVVPQNANLKYCRFLESLMSPETEYAVAITAFWRLRLCIRKALLIALKKGTEFHKNCRRLVNDGATMVLGRTATR